MASKKGEGPVSSFDIAGETGSKFALSLRKVLFHQKQEIQHEEALRRATNADEFNALLKDGK